ncbi:MAG TPA: GNAT family N-acetyltransferase [Aliiroseovarius sp.]|nr:GNAT family N-acetyltransferase [Aliiroseovarius sp.]
MEILWDQIARNKWEALADRVRAPMAQRWSYGAAHVALGGQVARAVLWQSGAPVGLCQVLMRRSRFGLGLGLASNGPLWLAPCDQARALALIRASLPLRRPRLRLVTPASPVASRRLLPLARPVTTCRRALPAQRESLHGKWRNGLKKAEQSGLNLRHEQARGTALQALLQADQQQQGARGYRALPARFTMAWQADAPKALRLFSAAKGGETHASALVLHHGNTASYHIAHSTAEGRQSGAARLVLWHIFEEMARRGVVELDLGRIDERNAPGLARFKLRSGAEPLRLGSTALMW